MDGSPLSGLGARILGDLAQDLKFGFEASAAPGQFVVTGFEAEEALFEGFEIRVDLVSTSPDLDLHGLLDTSAVLTVLHAYDVPRVFHGEIAEIEKRATGFARTRYRAVLRPGLHRLSYHSDARIFQEMDVRAISDLILGEHGIDQVSWDLQAPHEAREYCVQYGETSYDFLRRIWAEEGIFFWFEHGPDSHMLHLSDTPQASPALAAAPGLAYNAMPGGMGKGFWVSRFDQVERLRATRRVSRDYSFHQPDYDQQQSVGQAAANGAKGSYELYHYPGRHKQPATGQPFNDHALEAHRVDATTAEGETNAIQLSAGFTFALSDHPDGAANTSHRLLRVTHEGQQPAALEEDAPEGAATTYSARFTTQPARIAYRPINPNPKPMVEGPQIAHVTGPEGEEIYCDAHGRVKIWFPWDRHGEKNETSSCWVRVSQTWAGGSWGQIAIPRIGQEVVVDFLGGDPDQPIITGRTYHATNKPPYPLPENKTRMSIKSQTHKGEGYNELRFEDEKDEEEIRIHAQRDLNTIVRNDRSSIVMGSGIDAVTGIRLTETLGPSITSVFGGINIHSGPSALAMSAARGFGNFSDDVSKTARLLPLVALDNVRPGDINIAGDNNVTYSAGDSLITSAGKNSIRAARGDTSESVGRNLHVHVHGHHRTHVDRNQSSTVQGIRSERVEQMFDMSVGQSLSIRSGQSRIKMYSDGTIEISGTKISIDASEELKLNAPKIGLN